MTERASLSALLAATKGEPVQIEDENTTGKPIPRHVPLATVKDGTESRHLKAPTGKPQVKSAKVGKNQNPDYHKLTVYIPQGTRKAVGIKLLQDGGLDLSELVEQLLDGWTAGRLAV